MLGIAANQALFLYGLKHTTAINATILVTTVPVFTVLGSVLIGREPASLLKFAGMRRTSFTRSRSLTAMARSQ